MGAREESCIWINEPHAQNLLLLWGPSSSLCLGGGRMQVSCGWMGCNGEDCPLYSLRDPLLGGCGTLGV